EPGPRPALRHLSVQGGGLRPLRSDRRVPGGHRQHAAHRGAPERGPQARNAARDEAARRHAGRAARGGFHDQDLRQSAGSTDASEKAGGRARAREDPRPMNATRILGLALLIAGPLAAQTPAKKDSTPPPTPAPGAPAAPA